jgi:hypothetical protein
MLGPGHVIRPSLDVLSIMGGIAGSILYDIH